MSSNPAKIALNGLVKRLVEDRILAEDDAIEASLQARKDREPIVNYLAHEGIATSEQIANAAADEFGMPIFDLSSINDELIPKEVVKEELIRKHHVLPLFKRGNRLYVAMADPTQLNSVDELKFATGLNVDPIVARVDHIEEMINKILDSGEGAMDMDDTDFGDLEFDTVDEDAEEDVQRADADDAPIVKFVNKVLLDAIRVGASDIHFEPYEKNYRVRVRADGILQEMVKPPNNLAPRLAARLKVMSRMDISERRIPQDGRIKLKISKNRAIDFRVNTLPTLFGEKICLRILDPSSAKLGIDALGYEEDQKELYLSALNQPQGMILVTGPTGSGKTVSLYTGLNILNTPERNISTAEDPVEINLEGINQVNVNAKVGLDFGAALRSFLRQDPDIVMVGEIRDLETAEIAVKAAQTGHLVLSTLHTNSAAETLTRLRNMGVPSFNIATSVSLIIAQRLARRLCDCKEPIDVPKQALLESGFSESEIGSFTLFGPKGCPKCNKTGYKGRVGIYEVVKITDGIARIIMEDGNSIQIADQQKKEGFNSLRQSGLLKAKSGVTSLEEVNRVTTGH